jgi:2-polyprenyl-6-methoxyphenol hydroxylase-like FAD-dependent oxidoreductase
VRPEAVDASARLASMDASGVEAEVLFPSPRLQNAIAALPDPAFQAALVSAYNDWLSEFCGYDPARSWDPDARPSTSDHSPSSSAAPVAGLRGALLAVPDGGRSALRRTIRSSRPARAASLHFHVGLNLRPARPRSRTALHAFTRACF